MSQKPNDFSDVKTMLPGGRLRVLTSDQVRQIDRALADLGPSAEVRLIKARGRLRFLQKIDSENVSEPQ
jgi:hypothetical protein